MRRKIFFFVLFTGIGLSLFSFQGYASSLKVKVVTIEDCPACSTEATEKLLKNIENGTPKAPSQELDVDVKRTLICPHCQGKILVKKKGGVEKA